MDYVLDDTFLTGLSSFGCFTRSQNAGPQIEVCASVFKEMYSLDHCMIWH